MLSGAVLILQSGMNCGISKRLAIGPERMCPRCCADSSRRRSINCTRPIVVDARVVKPRFFSEAKDFLRFIVRPRFAPRLPPRRAVDGWYADWFPAVPVGRLVQWACVLWAINLFFLGPIALMAATAGGAETRLDLRSEEHTSELQSLMRISYA